MIKLVRWIVVNIGILSLFLIGEIQGISGFSTFAVILFWITALIGIFGGLVFAKAIVDKEPDWVPTVPVLVDVGYDVIVVGVLAGFGYPILAVLYMIQIYGSNELRKKIQEIQKERKERNENE